MTLALFRLFAPVAHAAEPPAFTAAPAADGAWNVDLVVPAPLGIVRALLADPIAAAKFSPDIVSIAYVSRGACDTLHAETGVSFAPVAYDYRRCPTPTGWRETLLSSTGLSAYDVTWQLEPDALGTRMLYRIAIETNFPAPGFLVAGHLRDSMHTVVSRIYRAATGG